MNTHFETPRDRFLSLKRQVLKVYPSATTVKNTDGTYSVLDSGINPIDDRYPDLQSATSISTAWHNLKTIEHWQRIQDRNNRGFIIDKANISIEDYIVEQPITEESIYKSEKDD